MWDPATEEWTPLLPMGAQRTYHSVVLLLPDGRILSGGGGLCGTCEVNHFDIQIFTPPQLLRASGAPLPRPSIELSAVDVPNGEDISVTSTAPLTTIAMIRYGSATHSVNTDQRRLELCGPAAGACGGGGGPYSVTVPEDPGIAIAGFWMVFGVGDNGAHSESVRLHVGATPAQVGAAEAGEDGAIDSAATTASSSDAMNGSGTAAPVTLDVPATPAEPADPMPDDTQLD